MKIYEIIDTETQTFQPSEYTHTSVARDPLIPRPSYLPQIKPKNPQGVFSYITTPDPYEKPEDAGIITKHSFDAIDLEKDAYYQFVKAIEPYIKSNPFLPRIYVTKLYPNNTNYKVKYDTERLDSIDETDEAFLQYLFQLLQVPEEQRDKLWQEHTEKGIPSGYSFFIKMLIYAIEDNDYRIFTKKLAQVLQLISSILTKNKSFKLDLHHGNLMIRRTSHGPQLVIMDPIASPMTKPVLNKTLLMKYNRATDVINEIKALQEKLLKEVQLLMKDKANIDKNEYDDQIKKMRELHAMYKKDIETYKQTKERIIALAKQYDFDLSKFN